MQYNHLKCICACGLMYGGGNVCGCMIVCVNVFAYCVSMYIYEFSN